jgi:hypothetical protein
VFVADVDLVALMCGPKMLITELVAAVLTPRQTAGLR